MLTTQNSIDNQSDLLRWIGLTTNDEINVFVQGFGVRSDSKGLFSYLANQLLEHQFSSVLFHLSDYDLQRNATFLTLSQQQARILEAVRQIQEINPNARLNFIGHSMGCGVLSTLLDQLPINKAIMLAPARDNPGPLIYKGMIKHFKAQEEGDLIRFPRKNGTISTFSKAYVEEFDIKFSQFYKDNWPQIKHLLVVLADEDLGNYDQTTTELYKSFKAQIMANCDHNFSNEKRQELSQILINFLT